VLRLFHLPLISAQFRALLEVFQNPSWWR
jgi:hypothetical protein